MYSRIDKLVAAAVMATFVAAANAQNFDLMWFTIDGGGGNSTGGLFEIDGTIGQADAGPNAAGMTGGSFTVVGGFWPGAATAAPCLGDLDGDGLIGLSDLALFLSNFGTPSGATREQGDFDGDGDVDLTDLALLLSVFGTPCP